MSAQMKFASFRCRVTQREPPRLQAVLHGKERVSLRSLRGERKVAPHGCSRYRAVKCRLYSRNASGTADTKLSVPENGFAVFRGGFCLQKGKNIYKEAFSEKNADLEALRVQYLGKKGELTSVLRGMGQLSAEERPKVGQMANEVRAYIEQLIEEKKAAAHEAALEAKLEAETVDVTLPTEPMTVGSRHPLSLVQTELEDIFIGLGFEIVEGPEVEYDYYNFQALNIPENHPARDTQDTFYITDNVLLRSQTSPVQVHVMEKERPPIRILSPGRVYRSEPSAEVDVSCFVCGGKGCSLCKGEGWIEILGAGMVHPNVLRGCDIDPDVYSGFAFGLGIERIVMRKYNIDDMRLLYENDVRFLKQFN